MSICTKDTYLSQHHSLYSEVPAGTSLKSWVIVSRFVPLVAKVTRPALAHSAYY